jgi:hypothetical protein
MVEPLIDWSSPGNYIAVCAVIGLILFGLLIGNFIWIYRKYSKKDETTYGWKKETRTNHLIRQFAKQHYPGTLFDVHMEEKGKPTPASKAA